MIDEKRLSELVQSVFEARREAVTVSPSWLATETMARLDPGRASEPNIYLAAHLQFRQVARSILRRNVRLARRQPRRRAHRAGCGVRRRRLG